MFITNDALDIERYESGGIRPATLLIREPEAVWVVREQPLDTDLSPRFLWVMDGTNVRVPLHPYLVNGSEAATAMGMATKLGLLVLYELRTWLGLKDFARLEVVRAHITVGHPVQEWGNGLRFWAGMAFQLREFSGG